MTTDQPRCLAGFPTVREAEATRRWGVVSALSERLVV
jgi:hypothetical protein